ncbi:MAG: PEP-CTERM sorting domain-containing protein, partial [Akkermansia sp.]|nr:PEP-CTERM sorting domain-containing protein [Akkermansia sp.]
LTLAVTPDSAEKIELVLAGNAVYTGSEQIILFLNVGKAVFTYGEAGTTSGSLKMMDAANYFTGAGINETTQLVYDQEGGTVYLQGVVTIPEPATATLGLLALAGLCARRRRK